MNSYRVEWAGWDDDGEVIVETTAALDDLLNRLETAHDDGHPYQAGIFAEGVRFGPLPVGLQLTLGHPQRACVRYTGPDGSGTGYDATLPPWTGGPITVNTGGAVTEVDADRLLTTPEQARAVAREFVQTGRRPTCLRWQA